MTEELLAAGAPVAAHWVADRQIGPVADALRHRPPAAALPARHRARRDLLRHRHERARVGLGPGERPDPGRPRSTAAGSSAARRCGPPARTTRTPSSCWRAREPLDPAHRHAGLSQFIVELDSPGIEIRPIRLLTGQHHFNEVVLDKVFVPDELVLGRPATAGRRSPPSWPSSAAARSGSCPRSRCSPRSRGARRGRTRRAARDGRRAGRPAVHAAPAVAVHRRRAVRRGAGRAGRGGQGPRHAVREGGGRRGRGCTSGPRRTPGRRTGSPGCWPKGCCTRRASPCAAGRPRSCAASWREDWGCDERRRAATRWDEPATVDDCASWPSRSSPTVATAGAGFDAALWKTLAGSGLTRLTAAGGGRRQRGHDGRRRGAAAAAGAYAARVPLVETDLLAGWLAHAAGIPCRTAR